MSLSKVISKQDEKTWSELHRRLISLKFDYSSLFPEVVYSFMEKKSLALTSCIGYLVPCLLTTTAFVVSIDSLISNESHTFPSNIYMMIIGPPTTGKSPAMRDCAVNPMIALQNNADIGNFVVERCTSPELVKILSETKKAIILSPELFDILNKMLKNDDEHATGDVQMLCKLFSGERTSHRFATKTTLEIPSNVPFSILGTTQMPLAARIIARLDQGQGLLDRFLFLVPSCLRPYARTKFISQNGFRGI
jgi:hypothetical protein